jgi:hypothetical protein
MLCFRFHDVCNSLSSINNSLQYEAGPPPKLGTAIFLIGLCRIAIISFLEINYSFSSSYSTFFLSYVVVVSILIYR